jgi:tripartite-type tricarboxylate transporter receptor subunit TctC
MRYLISVVAFAAVTASVAGAVAQSYPSRPVTVIVPFAAGGATDVTARIVGEHMSRTLGQRIIVENIVGAGGTVGSTPGNARQSGRLHP